MAKRYGAAVIVMAFDEDGQAESADQRFEICERCYDLLTRVVGMDAHDIVFDPNIFAVGTGIEEPRQLRRQLSRSDAADQGLSDGRAGERRREQRLVRLPRQQPRPRGDALCVPLPRVRRRHGHGNRQLGPTHGVSGHPARSVGTSGGSAAEPPCRCHGPAIGDRGLRHRPGLRRRRGPLLAAGARERPPHPRTGEGDRRLRHRRYRGGPARLRKGVARHRGSADGRHERRR